ncbi:MAG: permease [Chloroflexota bacterium]
MISSKFFYICSSLFDDELTCASVRNMNQATIKTTTKLVGMRWARILLLLLAIITAWRFWPVQTIATMTFVLKSMVDVAPLAIPGILITAWGAASGAGGHIKHAIEGKRLFAIVTASFVGAVTPVCGVTVLPLMAGLLASGVPLAPVMAFWLSSPVTDPAMFAVTGATLGFGFAIGKTVAAFFIGMIGGLVSSSLSRYAWVRRPLREDGLASSLMKSSNCQASAFEFAIWKDAERQQQFLAELWAVSKLLLIVLGLAFAAEHVMHQFLEPEDLSKFVGRQSAWAIPLAVFVGSPAYLDGYAALPLTRGLMDYGMSPGAAMAFLVSGGVVSIWGAMAIFPVLRLKPFMLYLAIAVVGSLASGYVFEMVY